MTDLDHIVEIAYLFNRLRAPVLHSAIQALQLSEGSQGLDVGCSVGLQTILLAEIVGPAGHITGLDLSPDILVSQRISSEKLACRREFPSAKEI